ncbi:lysozyme [Massilia rubra]|uniref:Lysozyme n=1 Tax=Massilia rubra TaxID=2607910 RepID=A0ABX0LU98_9BURK|nr:lysozyme [Massilia rubra]NHZ36430.1 lysozyme [Massilia rubra]
MKISNMARVKMRQHEKVVMRYYDDMGPGRGNCSWGIGILEHRGPCTAEELARPVTVGQVEAEFSSRVQEAERTVERRVTVDLTEEQFDALVSFTFNRGSTGATPVFDLLNAGDFDGAADRISSEIYGRTKKKGKSVMVLLKGLVSRRKEESAPFREKK